MFSACNNQNVIHQGAWQLLKHATMQIPPVSGAFWEHVKSVVVWNAKRRCQTDQSSRLEKGLRGKRCSGLCVQSLRENEQI